MLKTSGYGYEVGLRRLSDQPPEGGFVGVARGFNRGRGLTPVVQPALDEATAVGVGSPDAEDIAVTGSHSWRALPVVQPALDEVPPSA